MWTFIEHAEQGRGHIANSVPCQDKTHSIEKNGVSAIALADGAGSAKLSHHGAAAVCKGVCEYFCDNFDDIYENENAKEISENLINHMLTCLNTLVEELACDIKDLSSTILTVATKDDKYILAHCGDGVMGYMKNDELKVASRPANGEFANQTFFVTSRNASSALRLAKGQLNGIRAFVAISDGSEASLYSKSGNYLAKAIEKMINNATYMPVTEVKQGVSELFKNAIIKKTTDDCSIAIILRRDSSTSKYNSLSFEERCEIFSINHTLNNSKYTLQRAEVLIQALQSPVSIDDLTVKSGIKTVSYLKKRLENLIENNLVKKDEEMYSSLLCI